MMLLHGGQKFHLKYHIMARTITTKKNIRKYKSITYKTMMFVVFLNRKKKKIGRKWKQNKNTFSQNVL